MKSLFIVAGEISGDSHAAALIEALPSSLEWKIDGLGGPRMVERAPAVEDWLADAAVLGLWEVLRHYSYFAEKMRTTVAAILEGNPDAVVLVDYPGFNLRLAKRLRAGGYGGKLIYYISPQVWAWKRGRIRTMARLLDRMICIFPFEKELYESSGLPTDFAGHPLVDSPEMAPARWEDREADLVALLPGSRSREIEALFPPMLEAARILRANRPQVRFATSGATPTLTERLGMLVAEAGMEDCIDVLPESSREVMRRAAAGVVASGTATLEAACLGMPYCLVYRVAWLTAFAARRVMKVRFLGIVNVIAGREVVRELLQERATGPEIASELERLLDDETGRETLRRDLREVVELLGGGGAHRNAARAVVTAIEGDS